MTQLIVRNSTPWATILVTGPAGTPPGAFTAAMLAIGDGELADGGGTLRDAGGRVFAVEPAVGREHRFLTTELLRRYRLHVTIRAAALEHLRDALDPGHYAPVHDVTLALGRSQPARRTTVERTAYGAELTTASPVATESSAAGLEHPTPPARCTGA